MKSKKSVIEQRVHNQQSKTPFDRAIEKLLQGSPLKATPQEISDFLEVFREYMGSSEGIMLISTAYDEKANITRGRESSIGLEIPAKIALLQRCVAELQQQAQKQKQSLE